MMLLLLFVVEVELVDGPGATVEIDTQGTMYYIISDMGAESSLAEGALSFVFWSTAILAIIGLFVSLATFLSYVIGIFIVEMLSNITVDVSVLDVIAEVSVGFPMAFIFIVVCVSLVAIYCTSVYGIQFRTRKGKPCIQEYTPFS